MSSDIEQSAIGLSPNPICRRRRSSRHTKGKSAYARHRIMETHIKPTVGYHYNLRPSNPIDIHTAFNHTCDSNVGSLDDFKDMYAAEAVRLCPDYQLVEVGPMAVGCIPTGRVVHMNFKAKGATEPFEPVETFFAELTITHGNVVSYDIIIPLAPSDSLPEIADTGGCLYCSSHNIHHPDRYDVEVFRCGREQYWLTLRDHVKKLNDFLTKGEQNYDYFVPSFSHPGVKYISKSSQLMQLVRLRPERDDVAEHANAALSLFNELEGTSFVLVKTGCFRSDKALDLGALRHLNFEAENKDDPEAQVHTFFAEVVCTTKFFFVDFCKGLGPSVLLPGEVDLHGCVLCIDSRIHHPPGPGYLTGRENCEAADADYEKQVQLDHGLDLASVDERSGPAL